MDWVGGRPGEGRRRRGKEWDWRRSVWRKWWWHNRNCGGEPRNAHSPANRRVARRIGAKQHFHAAQMDGLAWLQRGFRHGRAIDKSPVRRSQIFDNDIAAIDNDAAMRPGYRGIGDFEIIRNPASDGISTGLEFDFPSSW